MTYAPRSQPRSQPRSHRALTGSLVALGLAALAPDAFAQDRPVRENPLDVSRGEQLADIWCSNCHVIGTTPQTRALADAPTFYGMVENGLADERTLAFALLSPHPVMPIFPVTQADIAALAAYMRSLLAEDDEDARLGDPPPLVEEAASGRGDGPMTNSAAGEEMADELCSSCHAVRGPGPSPIADAPAFSTLSERYPIRWLEEAFGEGIVVRHPTVQMPEFRFEPAEIDALLSYLELIQAEGAEP